MGVFNRLKGLLGMKTEEMQDQYRRLGLNLVRDEKIAARVDEVEAYIDEIYHMEDPVEKLKSAEKLVSACAVAWHRAGSNRWAGRMLGEWEFLLADAKWLVELLNGGSE
ncbi:MAG: hypothetical protein ACK4TI_05470, partial [Nitrososphaerales archaeon]